MEGAGEVIQSAVDAGSGRPLTSVLVIAETRLESDVWAAAIGRDSRFRVVERASSGKVAILAIRRRKHDLALLRMPLGAGLGLVRSLQSVDSVARIVIVGVAADEREIRTWSEAGVRGYVGGDASLEELSQVVLAVARGETCFSPDIASTLLRGAVVDRGERSTRNVPRLTHRETEVLGLLDRGLSNKQIAAALGVEVATVKNHAQNIFRKLGIHRRGDTNEWADIYHVG